MRQSLKTTTALLASLALITPSVLPAQETAEPAVECPEGAEQPCDPVAEALENAADAVTDAVPGVEAEAEAETATEAEPAEAPAETTEQPAAEAEAEVAPDATADEQPADATAEPAAKAEAEAEAETEAEPEKAEQPAAEVEAPAAETAEQPAAETAEQPAAETAEQPAAETAEQPAAETAEQPAAETAEQPAAETAEQPAATEADTKAATETNAETGTTTEPEAPAAAATDATADEGEMTTETVTEDTARTSDQDFGGEINADAGADADTDSGLSKFEKALLLGAGALAVGAVIKGNREVVSTSQDRLIVTGKNGELEVLKDDDALLRQPGSEIQTRTFDDGSTRTVTTRADGSQVITVRNADLRVLRRVLVRTDGSEVVLIDDTMMAEPVDVASLPEAAPDVRADTSADDLRAALERQGAFDRRFSLSQIRQISEVRKLAPAIEVDTITFETGSAAIQPEQARSLTKLGQAIAQMIERNPNEVFLVEGHTDAVGSASTNLLLSDRRAESLALALTEYFGVAPENLVVQGYGESDLKVATDTAEQANRRAGVRRITELMQVARVN